MAWLLVVLTISLLIFFNALYVAAEFSTVSARHSRLTQLANEGNAMARFLLSIVREPKNLDSYIAACQLGITASSLVLGFYGQSRLTPVIAPYLNRFGNLSEAAAISITTTGVLLFLTALQVILGELLPKSIGIQYPERLALLTALPMRWSNALFTPFIWLFNGSGQLILRMLGLSAHPEHLHIHQPQEIMMLVEESSAGGVLDQVERRLLTNSLQLGELSVRQVMIPRNRMLAASADQECSELLGLLADSPFSRLPLYDGSVDNIIGIVHLKDLLCLRLQTGQHDVREAMRPVPFVPETLPVDEVFAMLQRKRYHVAIVLDEYGGTAGLVSLEDLIEEIFGELQDEFDTETTPSIKFLSEDRVQLRGDFLIDELNEVLDLDLPNVDIDTIGGLVLNQLGHVPDVGERLQIDGLALVVEAMDGNGVKAVSLSASPEEIERLREWQ